MGGEDQQRLEEDGPDQEQGWKDREQEGFRGWQASLQAHLGLDEGRAEGAQTAEGEGIRGGEEGIRALQACEGLLWQVRRQRQERQDQVVRAPERGVFCALSRTANSSVCQLRGA